MNELNVTTKFTITDFRDDLELLRTWKQVCRKEFVWRPSMVQTALVRSGKHEFPHEARAEARRMALDMGYTPPKWYEFWRWGEETLP